MSSDETPNGDTMGNEQKDEEMKSNAAAEDGKEDAEQKDEKDGDGDKEEMKSNAAAEDGKEDAEQKDEKDKDGDKEGEEEEEEEESSSDEELPLGSVEAPVQIMTGKRDRKKVERLVMKETPKTPEKKFVVPVGKGVQIGDIPIVAHFLEKTKSQDLKPLHKFLFGKMVRDPRENKRNIRQFSGFEFSKEDPDYTKREALLVKFTMEGIKEICTILDVEKKGNKDVIMERIMEFCLNPQPSGRKLPEKGKKKSKSKGTKKKKTKAKKQKGEGKKGGGDASTETEEDGDTTMDDGTEGDAEGEDGDTSMTEGESKPKKKKKKPKTTTPKTQKESAKTKTKSPKKIAVKTPSKQTKKSSPVKSPKKAPQKTPQKRNHDVVDDDSSDEEPLMKKIKAPPSDKQIKETVKEILEGANLEEVTMKMVCRKVYDIYPQHPLQHKKDFIKSTVREIIS
ncbi:protein DEK-like [Strongylocentrotus purpuratus]|uniref:DEK-C domain-containing protein n=1 Tax=Strongylocentrotus purpuratus TaxID=7668 RepID=A0A7M7NKA1_STRPU|nr:protein DEK-like [Strongylocentrotus purpuratus]